MKEGTLIGTADLQNTKEKVKSHQFWKNSGQTSKIAVPLAGDRVGLLGQTF